MKIAFMAMALLLIPQSGPFPGMPGNVSVANGTVRIDQWTCFIPTTAAPPSQRLCPTRIEIGVDVPDDTLVCRSTPTGQTCRNLGSLFRQGK